MNSNWIKLNDWKKVHFPAVCPFSGLKACESKNYFVYNDSLLWKILWFFRVSQYIQLTVPWSEEGLNTIKTKRRKAILHGLALGAVIALLGLVFGVWMAVEAANKQLYNVGIIFGGCSFVFSLILFPIIFDYRVRLKLTPIYFKKKNEELWVKIINDDYRRRFLILNDFMQISEQSKMADEILDHGVIKNN